MRIAQNKFCDAIDYREQLQQRIKRESEKTFKSDFMKELTEDKIKICQNNIKELDGAITNYLAEYPEEKCSCNCSNCPLALTA